MNSQEKIKLLGREIRRLSSITDYVTDCEMQLGLINRNLADDVYRLKGKIKEVQQKIENYKETTEANIRWEKLMKEEHGHNVQDNKN